MKTKKQLVFLFLVFLLKHKVTYASNWPTNRISELNVYLQGFVLESFKVNTIFECYRRCEENLKCLSININLKNNTCEMKYSTKARNQKKTVTQQNTIYMGIRDGAPGSKPDIPIKSCKTLKEDDSQAKSGVYWMNFNEPSSAPFQVFCDMTTDGGGWTLVYSYTFTRFSSFISWSNAVTPIPNWPVDMFGGTWVPRSTTTPLNESSHSAMDFALWKKIGNEVLLKSNITNWIACVEGTGSLVNWVTGTVTCRIVKNITSTCSAVTSDKLEIESCGPFFKANRKFQYYLDGNTDKPCWPTHDPCGASEFVSNHKTDVPNPSGTVYIR